MSSDPHTSDPQEESTAAAPADGGTPADQADVVAASDAAEPAATEDTPVSEAAAAPTTEDPQPEVTEPAAASASPSEPTAAADSAPAADPGEATAAEPADSSEPEQARPRVRLNPVADPSQVRAVGTVDAVEQPGLVPAAGDDRPVPPPKTAPPAVDIPDIEDLDSQLEAEISAAMTVDAEPPTAPAAPVDAGAEETEQEVGDDGLPGEGARLTGTVDSIHADNVFLNVGLRLQAVVPLRQFESGKHPAVGSSLDVVVERTDDDDSLLIVSLPRGTRKIAGNWDDVAPGQVVDCLVKKTNKGGLEVTVSNLRAFLPASQIEFGYVADLEPYVGQKLRVQVTEVNAKKRNLVVSRRALMQAERDAQSVDFWQTVEVGSTHTGTVKTLKDYGAFINIGPVDGFLHIGEISWSRIGHPSEVLTEGQQVEVKILKIDPDKQRIGLGMRQLTQNPWTLAPEKYASGRTVQGRVTRTADFGAFVELEAGIEGLVHISELAWRRVRAVSDVLEVGQTSEFKVLEVDPQRKRISLSLKATQEKPETASAPAEEEDSAPPPPRRPAKDLKGGTGDPSGLGGGLFGNPSDYS